MDWQEHIISDKTILGGKPIIKNTRLSIEFIFERLADGWTEEMLLANYPTLSSKDIQAIFAYAHECIKDGLLFDKTLVA